MEFLATNMFVWLIAAIVLGVIGFGSQIWRMGRMLDGDVQFGRVGLAITLGGTTLSGLCMLLFVASLIINIVQ